MKIVVTEQEIQEVWNAARAGTDDPDEVNEYAEGAYAMIQFLTGGGSKEELLDGIAGE